MKHSFFCLFLLLTLVGCMEQLQQTELHGNDGKETTMKLALSVDDNLLTKSSIGADSSLDAFESKVSNITLFMFENVGNTYRLHHTFYHDLTGNNHATLRGVIGRKYRIYALANCGDKRASVKLGETENALNDILVTSTISSLSLETGMPMACGPVELTVSNGVTVNLAMTRLMARFDLKLVQDFSHGSFKLKSLKLRQSPTVTHPFNQVDAFKTTQGNSLADGDYASPANVTSLMNGSTVRFYTLENACGVLLNNPTKDPSLKIPSNGTTLGGYLPTYIEAVGTYTDNTGGLVCENTYRMFLGENAYDNFNVKKGQRYTLTLTLRDSGGFLENSWKLDPIVSDSRNFRFSKRDYVIESSSSIKVNTLNNQAGYGITYQLSNGLTGVTFDPVNMYLSQGVLYSTRTGTLSAYYWDGRLADQCTVTAKEYIDKLKPIGIEEIEPVWASQSFQKIHDPNCPIQHGEHDDNCPNAALHMHPNHPNYMDPIDCPYRHGSASDCHNTILVPSGAGIVGLKFVIANNYRVDSTGKLIYDVLTPNVDYELLSAELLSIDGKEFTDKITYLDPSFTGNKAYVECQFQEPGRTHWHIEIRALRSDLDQEIRHYIVSNSGDTQTIYPDYMMLYPRFCTYINTFQLGCTNPKERIWLLSDTNVLEFENETDMTRLNSFMPGDQIYANTYQKEKIVPIYALNKNGAIIATNKFNTNGVCPNIIKCEYQDNKYNRAPILSYGFYTGFLGCYLPISVFEPDMYLSFYDGPDHYLITIDDSIYFTVNCDGYFLTADYQGQEHMTSWSMDMTSINIGGVTYGFEVRDNGSWTLTP